MPPRSVPPHHASHQGTGRDWFPYDAYSATRDVKL